MKIFKNKNKTILSILGLYLILDCSLGSMLFPTHAEQSKNNKSQNISYNGLPYNRRDGGSRGNCLANRQDFVALVPDNPINKTASISPQLFFYIPQSEKTKEVEFIVRDEEDKLVYKTSFQTITEGGIASITIPKQVQENSKKSFRSYHWYLSFICNSQKRSQDIVLEGWIEYVELDNSVKEKVSLSNFVTKSQLLQQEGIWYDAIATLAEQKKSDSDIKIIQTEWSKLLDFIGLSNLASEPLIQLEVKEP